MTTEEKIKKQLAENPIILYMKGVPDNPECGFSAKTVAALKATKFPFAFVNVLSAPFIREKLPHMSKWPTFPQLFINGELIGGCDIVESMAVDGSLIKALQAADIKPAEHCATEVVSHTEVMKLIKTDYPDASIYIEGEGCDLTITVISDQFESLSMVKQQQGVMATLTEPLSNGRLHAVSIKAYTQAEWQQKQSADSSNGLLQIQL